MNNENNLKNYTIFFSDGTDTTGKAKNKTEMRKQANRYIRAWHLDCRVINILADDEFIPFAWTGKRTK